MFDAHNDYKILTTVYTSTNFIDRAQSFIDKLQKILNAKLNLSFYSWILQQLSFLPISYRDNEKMYRMVYKRFNSQALISYKSFAVARLESKRQTIKVQVS